MITVHLIVLIVCYCILLIYFRVIYLTCLQLFSNNAISNIFAVKLKA